MALSTQSFFTRDTNNSTRTYALAASDASYMYYNNITWSMWVAMQPGVNKTIWSQWEDTASNNRSFLFSTQDNGTFRVIFSWNGTNFSLHTTANPIFTYAWINIVVTFASGVFNVYVNDTLQTLTTVLPWTGGSVGLHASGQREMFGGHNPAAPGIDQSAGGCMMNFSKWNKVLSAAERTELYNAGVPGDLAVHSAVANLTNWKRIDQSDTAPTLIDSIAAGANMTITKTGTNPYFNPSLQVPGASALSTDPGETNVLFGIGYFINGAAKTGSRIAPTAAEIADAVWDEVTSGHTISGSFGALEQKQLTTSKFLGLK